MTTYPDGDTPASGPTGPVHDSHAGLRAGDRFPIEALQRSGASLLGPTVVYFYPKDGTETCTREAAAFQRASSQYRAAGIEVVGVSTDDDESHRSFARDEGIDFRLFGDPDAALTARVGVLKDYGEHGTLAARVTFLLDSEGTVRHVFAVGDDVTSHPAAVLAEARRLGLVPRDTPAS